MPCCTSSSSAGSVMYEFGMRMRHEVRDLKGLQRQAKCYLACMNVLKLGDPKYAWILKPAASTSEPATPTNEDNGMEPDAETGSPPKRARTEESLQVCRQATNWTLFDSSMLDDAAIIEY